MAKCMVWLEVSGIKLIGKYKASVYHVVNGEGLL